MATQLKLAQAMDTVGAELPKFASFETLETQLQADGKALSSMGRGHTKAIAAFVTAYALTNEVTLNKVADTLNDVWVSIWGDAQEQKALKSKVLWACREAFQELKGAIDASDDDEEAIGLALAHFQAWPMFVAYNERNKAKADKAKADASEAEDAGAKDERDAEKIAIGKADVLTAASIAEAALNRLMQLAEAGDDGARQLADKMAQAVVAKCAELFTAQVAEAQAERKAA